MQVSKIIWIKVDRKSRRRNLFSSIRRAETKEPSLIFSSFHEHNHPLLWLLLKEMKASKLQFHGSFIPVQIQFGGILFKHYQVLAILLPSPSFLFCVQNCLKIRENCRPPIWRIIRVSKWLIPTVSKSPSRLINGMILEAVSYKTGLKFKEEKRLKKQAPTKHGKHHEKGGESSASNKNGLCFS